MTHPRQQILQALQQALPQETLILYENMPARPIADHRPYLICQLVAEGRASFLAQPYRLTLDILMPRGTGTAFRDDIIAACEAHLTDRSFGFCLFHGVALAAPQQTAHHFRQRLTISLTAFPPEVHG